MFLALINVEEIRRVLYTVQIRLDSDDFLVRMSEMREWLDRQKVEPSVFQYRMFVEGVLFRVDFKTSADAAAFAEAFTDGGRAEIISAGREPRPHAGVSGAGILAANRCRARCCGGTMQSLLIERSARRCRELMLGARNAAVVEQLRVWLKELEEQLEALPRAADDQAPRLPTIVTN